LPGVRSARADCPADCWVDSQERQGRAVPGDQRWAHSPADVLLLVLPAFPEARLLPPDAADRPHPQVDADSRVPFSAKVVRDALPSPAASPRTAPVAEAEPSSRSPAGSSPRLEVRLRDSPSRLSRQAQLRARDSRLL